MDEDSLKRRRHALYVIAAIVALIIIIVPLRVGSTYYVVLETEYPPEVFEQEELPEDMQDVTELSVVTKSKVPVYDDETERILYAIAACESGHRQFDASGNVLMNSSGSSATGMFQIMSSIWRPIAEAKGINIDTEAGNKKMAYYILTEAQGIQAWEASRSCLSKYNIHI